MGLALMKHIFQDCLSAFTEQTMQEAGKLVVLD